MIGIPGQIPEVPYNRIAYEINDRLVTVVSNDRVTGVGVGRRIASEGSGRRSVSVPFLVREV
jgi:hypothetical protein